MSPALGSFDGAVKQGVDDLRSGVSWTAIFAFEEGGATEAVRRDGSDGAEHAPREASRVVFAESGGAGNGIR